MKGGEFIMSKTPKSGVYETEYGNACEYEKGSEIAFDIDMQEEIPTEMVNFDSFIREIWE